MEISKVYVIGAGLMGNGIAQVVATSGLEVTIIDKDQEAINRAYSAIEKSLGRIVKKGNLSNEKAKEIRNGIKATLDLNAAKEADAVIEAVDERLNLKKDIFARLDEVCAKKAIFMSNTSQFSITELASVTGRRDRFIGTHWFNPPVIMKLVEVVMGQNTSEETLKRTLNLLHLFGKETVVCKKDRKGFITTRIIWATRMEAFRIMEEGVASVEEIDKAVRLAFNHPMGPFELMDFGHLDLSLQVVSSLRDTYGDRFLPPESLKNLVRSGYLGRRTGRGWYVYDKDKG